MSLQLVAKNRDYWEKRLESSKPGVDHSIASGLFKYFSDRYSEELAKLTPTQQLCAIAGLVEEQKK